jgi:flagellar motor protein MotB
MTAQLVDTRKDLKMAELAYDTLLINQQQIINEFQRGVVRAESVITQALEANLPDGSYFLTVGAGEVVLSVQENVLFKPKSVEQLNGEEAALVLRAVMDALQSDPLLKLTIVGHTDNQPNPRRGTNNWEYAALRATSLAEELAKTYYLSPNRVVAASHGEFGPARSNATAEGQRDNRRVDFVLRNNVGNLLRELRRLEE